MANDRYECIIRLLGGTHNPNPEPEEVESLCRLLNTVGQALDEGKAKTRMNAIYEALDHMRVHSNLESRIKFKILVVPELSFLILGRAGLTKSSLSFHAPARTRLSSNEGEQP